MNSFLFFVLAIFRCTIFILILLILFYYIFINIANFKIAYAPGRWFAHNRKIAVYLFAM